MVSQKLLTIGEDGPEGQLQNEAADTDDNALPWRRVLSQVVHPSDQHVAALL